MTSLDLPLLPAEHDRPRLLLVDDDPGIIQVLARVLDPLGEVHFGLNGREGLEMAWVLRPEVILLDAEMPEMDGFEACSALKATPELADIPVIFLTAHREMEREIRALEIGAVDFIHKPISPPVVQARVRTHLALKRKNDDLQRLARMDGLTGVANRRAFDQALETEWRRATRTKVPLSLLLADVDFFKRFNDRYGHIVGDECLKAVAGVLAGMARRPGDIAARYGGEEFVLLLPHTGPDQALSVAQRLCERVEAMAIPNDASDAAPAVTVSVGVATVLPLCGDGSGSRVECQVCGHAAHCNEELPQAIVESADQALYEAKGKGRNQVASATLEVRALPGGG